MDSRDGSSCALAKQRAKLSCVHRHRQIKLSLIVKGDELTGIRSEVNENVRIFWFS